MKLTQTGLVLAGILALFVSPPFTCAEEETQRTDTFSIETVHYQINALEEKSVEPDGFVDVSAGDTLTLKKIVFTATVPEGKLSCWVEAYLHDGEIGGEEGVDYKNGRTASHLEKVSNTQYALTFGNGSWALGKNHDRVIVVLIHQFGKTDKDFRMVDKTSIHLREK